MVCSGNLAGCHPSERQEWLELARTSDELRFPIEARRAVMQSLRRIYGYSVHLIVSGKPIHLGQPIPAFHGDTWH